MKQERLSKEELINSVTGITNIESNLLQKIIIRIIEHFAPEKIILFGSYGYGKSTMDSDIDLLIIKEDVESKRSEAVKIRRVLRGFKMPFDIIVTTTREFEFYSKEWINSVFAEARKNGVVIYERIRTPFGIS